MLRCTFFRTIFTNNYIHKDIFWILDNFILDYSFKTDNTIIHCLIINIHFHFTILSIKKVNYSIFLILFSKNTVKKLITE
jgi:hypothetical protein